MKILRSILAVLSAPIVYGVLCVPLVSVIMAQNTDLLNDAGGTYNVALTLQAEAAQAVSLVIIGFLVSLIAPARELLHVAIAIALMLVIGVSVQVSFWESMLIWHHFVFFGLIVFGLLAGHWIRTRVIPPRDEGDGQTEDATG